MKEIRQAELRAIQLNILNVIDEFCKLNGIKYSLGGGTLLGAVRHNGFIPWDDDVDLMMPRPDYDLFLKTFTHPHIRIQYPGNSSDTYIYFAKVYDDRTILYEHYATNGVFVDLFPIDGLPPENEITEYCKIQQKYLNNLYKLHDYKSKAFIEYDKSLPLWLVKLKYWFKHLFYINRKDCIKKLDELHYSYDFETAEYAGAICGAYGLKEHMQKRIFEKYISINFETKKYQCIAQYHEYLTKHYGDYMQLPPIENRKPTHCFKAYWKD